jgi:uncharacterized protein with ATP-grasp and redox domains
VRTVKVEIECFPCVIQRGFSEIMEATDDPRVRFDAASALLRCLAKEFTPDAVAAVVGTMRDRLIKQVTGNLDIYAERKRLSNRAAMKLLPTVQRMLDAEASSERRFRRACLAAIVGNIIEFDIPQHEVNLANLDSLIARAEEDLAIDDLPAIYRALKGAKQVLFLADNAGEIALDKLLVAEVQRLGAKVTVAVKGGPILNDATLDDAQAVSMLDTADAVITTGADAVGLPSPKERSTTFQRAYDEAHFIVAKGMGYAETLTELEIRQPHALLLRTKCNPVAKHFGVARGKNVAKLLTPEEESAHGR